MRAWISSLRRRSVLFSTLIAWGAIADRHPPAQLDLKQYTTRAAVIRDFSHWTLLQGRLSAKEMPPKPMPQPPDQARQQVIDWIGAVRALEAKKNDGDPGPVLARRLSNSEYNYTIRDLTGVDLKPTREFPVDPANPAGFDNSGESLSMSPALLAKYLQAGREIANHMVLKPDGFAFAPFPMLVETDREKYCIERIVNFYERQPTDYADYFRALWMYRYRAALGKPKATLASIAAETKVSPKYLAMIREALEQPGEEVGPLARLQSMFRALPPPQGDQPDLVREACVAMRDFVVRIRTNTAMTFSSPPVQGLSPTSQPLMNWKLRQFASHRRQFDPAALRTEDEPADGPVMTQGPTFGGSEQQQVRRATAAALKARREDPDLLIPATERERYEAAFARFSNVFPDVFYVKERGRFYPIDAVDKGRLLSAGYHNVMGYFRDDTPLQELILDDKGKKELDELWEEFDLVGDQTTRTYVQYFFNQSGEVRGMGRESGSVRPPDKEITSEAIIFGLRDQYLAKARAGGNNPISIQAINEHFERVNATIRWVERARLEAEPRQLDALVKFAARAYRRPLQPAERDDILAYYHELRDKNGLTHEEAMRDSIVSILVSPDFCYRIDLVDAAPKPAAPSRAAQPRVRAAAFQASSRKTAANTAPAKSPAAEPLSDYALASRLSYFLWSSMPDDELLARAAAGELRNPAVLLAEARRMLKDERAGGFATEFGGNWLDFRRFEDHNGVDRERFPSFTNDLREAMFQEPIRFIDDVVRNDRSVLDLLYANYTFVNPVLARHYGMPDLAIKPDEWIRVENARAYGRGGILPMAVFLTQNAPGLRTSPVKRGYWVARRVLGEVIPPPPASVPELPKDESKLELPLREMLAKHRENRVCASCHARFDSFGLTFENYGPVGERRARDLGGHPVDVHADFPGGSEGSGLEGLETYIRANRQNDFIDNLCRKMTVYALNRSLMLSDEPLIERMRNKLTAENYRFSALVEAIISSPQFLNRRNPDLKELKGE